MRRILACLLPVLCAVAPALPNGAAQPSSEGHPHKWDTVDKSMVDFLDQGFELKAVVYDTSEKGATPDLPDVHYFLQKKTQLVRCDFRKREETSYYWCAIMIRPK
jgi:hypothetical protein